MRIKKNFFVSICFLIFSIASLVAQNLGTDLTYYGFTEYDENGNKVYGKTFVGQEYFYEYNDDGKLSFWLNIDSKWGDETACSIEYDSKGRIIHEDYGYEEYTYEYDSKGRIIHEISNNSGEFWYEYTFWDNGNVKLQKMYLVRTEETVG